MSRSRALANTQEFGEEEAWKGFLNSVELDSGAFVKGYLNLAPAPAKLIGWHGCLFSQLGQLLPEQHGKSNISHKSPWVLAWHDASLQDGMARNLIQFNSVINTLGRGLNFPCSFSFADTSARVAFLAGGLNWEATIRMAWRRWELHTVAQSRSMKPFWHLPGGHPCSRTPLPWQEAWLPSASRLQ